MPTRTRTLVASRHGKGKGGSFGSFFKGLARGVEGAAKIAAPVAIPLAIKALMGAGHKRKAKPHKRPRKGGAARRKPIGYY